MPTSQILKRVEAANVKLLPECHLMEIDKPKLKTLGNLTKY